MTSSWVKRTVELGVLLMLAVFAYIVIALVLDAVFGWGLADATRDFLDPVVPGAGSDPGDCDRRFGSC